MFGPAHRILGPWLLAVALGVGLVGAQEGSRTPWRRPRPGPPGPGFAGPGGGGWRGPGPPPPEGGGPWGQPRQGPEELARSRSSEFYADVIEVLGLQGRLLEEAAARARTGGVPEPVARFLATYAALRAEQLRGMRQLAELRARAPGNADFQAGLAELGKDPAPTPGDGSGPPADGSRRGPLAWGALGPVLAEGSALLRRQWDREIAPLVGALPGASVPEAGGEPAGAPGVPPTTGPAPAATPGPGPGEMDGDEDLSGLVLGLAGVLAVAIAMLFGPRGGPGEDPFRTYVEGLARLAFGDLHTLKNRAGIAPGDPGLAAARAKAVGALGALRTPSGWDGRLAPIATALGVPGQEAEAHRLAGDLLRELELPVFETLDRLVGRFCRDRAVELRPGLPGPPAYVRDRERAAADLELVVGNLVENAFQAGARTVRVEVESAEPARAATRIRVVDDGPGFREADRERALVAVFAERGPGRGTGLTTVARTARERGWGVVLEPGVPTTFTIEIPAGA